MKKLIGVRRVWVFGLVIFLAAALSLAVQGGGGPGVVDAFGGSSPDVDYGLGVSSRVACWTSGFLGEAFSDGASGLGGFGKEKEFVVDKKDLVGFEDGRYRLEPETDALDRGDVDWDDKRLSMFRDFPELIDLQFYMPLPDDDVNWQMADMKIAVLRQWLDGSFTDKQEEQVQWLLPWESKEDYFKRRSVARRDPGRVKMFSARWKRPEEPTGGLSTDTAAVLRDQQAVDIERVSGTMAFMEKGFRREIFVQEMASVAVSVDTDTFCSEGVCTEQLRSSSEPVEVLLQGQSRESNDGEEENSVVGADVRPLATDGPDAEPGEVEEVEVHNEKVEPSTVEQRQDVPSAYGELAQRDTDHNQIEIDITLKPFHRRDYEFNSGGIVGIQEIPGLGYSLKTYHNIGLLREGKLNDMDDEFESADTKLGEFESAQHFGFRQPMLDRGYGVSSRVGVPSNTEHIKWPVYLEDMNWYLYDLPGTERQDEWSLLWLNNDGGRWLVEGGYGTSAVPHGDGAAKPECELKGDVLLREKIECKDDPEWDSGKVRKGQYGPVYLPFNIRDGMKPGLLGSEDLLKAGVESPVDAGPNPGRKMNRFFFVIDESSKFGSEVETQGGIGLDRFGAPRRRAADEDEEDDDGVGGGGGDENPTYEKFVNDWPAEPVDPNQSYLLVITFYESRNPFSGATGGQDDRTLRISGEEMKDEAVKLPQRYLRRVMCRMLIHPSGIEPAVDENKNFFKRMFDNTVDGIKNAVNSIKGIIASIARTLIQLPMHGVKKTGEVACGGLGRLDKLTRIGGGPAAVDETVLGPDGHLKVNASVRSKRLGSELCYRINSPEVSTCTGGTDLVFDGYCANLPDLKMVERRHEFIDPAEVGDGEGIEFDEYVLSYRNEGGRNGVPVDDADYKGEEVVVGDDRALEFVASKVGTKFRPVWRDDGDEPMPRENFRLYQGITASHVGWEYKWPGVLDDVGRAIDGYVVYISPDPKASQGVAPGEWKKFELPKWLNVTKVITVGGDSETVSKPQLVDGFWLGGLGKHGAHPNPFVRVDVASEVNKNPDVISLVQPLGNKHVAAEYEKFVEFVNGLPLAPEYTHKVKVAPFNGRAGSTDFRDGNVSKVLELNGDRAACKALEYGSMGPDLRGRVELYYACGGEVMLASVAPDDDFRIGLLDLTGSDLCGDIFSSTPAILTWDNPVVKRVWGLMWILAGGVLFSLLAWQGVRMTYDVWIDPQPAVGLRELVPRFLLAIVMAAGSLVLAKLVLILSSDVTCFVAQMTGMSMWGVVGVTFGSIMDGVTAWMEAKGEEILLYSLVSIWAAGAITAVLALLVLFFVVFMLYLFVKVAFGMLMRIALLAALIAVAPLAFALYASDTTSRHTSWWIKAFLGAACQQVFVLIVIYLGANMLGSYMAEAAEGDLQVMLIGLMLALLTLALADSVPKIVNPSGQGMFDSFGKMAGMAGMAAMMVASGGVAAAAGGVSGGLAAFRAGGAGGAGGRGSGINMRMPSGGGGDNNQPDGGGGGGGGGGGNQPRLGGPPSSSGSFTTLNRSSFNPGGNVGGVQASSGGQAPGGDGSGRPAGGVGEQARVAGAAAAGGVVGGVVGSQAGERRGAAPQSGRSGRGETPAGEQASGAGDAGAQAPGSQAPASGAGDAGAQAPPPGAGAAGEQAPGSQAPASGAQAPGIPGVPVTGAGDAGAQARGSQAPGAQAPGSPGVSAAGAQAPGSGAPAAGAQAPGSGAPAAGAQAPGSPAPGASGAQASGSPGVPVTGAGAAGAQAPGSRAPGAQAPGSQAPGAQAPGSPGVPVTGAGAAGVQAPGSPGGQAPGAGATPPGGEAPGSGAAGTEAPGGGESPPGADGGSGEDMRGVVVSPAAPVPGSGAEQAGEGPGGAPAAGGTEAGAPAAGGTEAGAPAAGGVTGGAAVAGGDQRPSLGVRMMNFADRLALAREGAVAGMVSGFRSGARRGGELNDVMARVSDGSMFRVRPSRRGGGGGGEGGGQGQLSSAQEEASRELKQAMGPGG